MTDHEEPPVRRAFVIRWAIQDRNSLAFVSSHPDMTPDFPASTTSPDVADAVKWSTENEAKQYLDGLDPRWRVVPVKFVSIYCEDTDDA